MNLAVVSFGPGALTFIALYLLSLIGIGWWGYRSRREDTLREFYLAGRGFGLLVLVLTLYATQYSGNTLLGFTGKSYRTGFSWTMSVHFMTAIVVCYLIYAPRLYALARKRGFITPTDYLHDRFNSPAINVTATIIMVVALANFLLAQLMAMGRALEGFSAGTPRQAFIYGVIALALIMVIYESLGGMRAVAWTDAVQGIVLLLGFALVVVLVLQKYGSLDTTTTTILASENRVKALPPDAAKCREWLSYILLVGIGGALYPQAIQRIYSANSQRTLRRSFSLMAFMPYTAALVALIVGVTALANIPGLTGAEADKVLTVVLGEIQQDSRLGYCLVTVLFAAILAAVMSTADSALLSISSMVTKDLYWRYVDRNAREQFLTKLGKIVSWVLVAILIIVAIRMYDSGKNTLIKLLDRKFDWLVQLAPAFFIGIHWRRMRSGPVFYGMLAGLILAVVLAMCGHGKIAGIHAGLYGLVLNLLIALGGSLLLARRPSTPQRCRTANP